ncbi:MAG: hypothetical protein H6566_28710 [Lewinellaceae bacterium]|nr:hypothetical protein [Lewinellaceae bacterium]
MHEFYGKNGPLDMGPSADFALAPSSACIKLLAQHKMRWLAYPSRGKVITPLDEDEDLPKFALPVDTRLRFFLELKKPEAFGFTDFYREDTSQNVILDQDKILKGEAYPYFFNDQSGENLVEEVFHYFQADELEVRHPGEDEVFSLAGIPVSNLTASDFSVEGLNNESTVKHFDKTGKKVWIDTKGFEKGHSFQIAYRAVPPWPKQIVGVVDIVYDPGKFPANFEISLKSRRASWKYYIVSDSSFNNLSIIDTSTTNQKMIFTKMKEPSNDPLWDWLERKFPDAQTIALFRSGSTDTPFEAPFKENASKDLQLVDDGKVLRSHLPIPSRAQSENLIISYFS